LQDWKNDMVGREFIKDVGQSIGITVFLI